MMNAIKTDGGYAYIGEKGECFFRVQKFDKATFDNNAINHYPMNIHELPCIEIYEEVDWVDKKMWLWYDEANDQFYYCWNAGVEGAFSYPLEPGEAKKTLNKYEKRIWEIKSMEKGSE